MADRPEDGTDLDELRSLAGRLDPEGVTWEAPPADLWDRIAAEAGVPTDEPRAPTDAPGADEPGGDAPGVAPVAPVAPLDRARRRGRGRTLPWLLAAAAAVVVVAAVATLVLVDRGGDATLVASAPLERLGPAGTGSAELLKDHGDLRLHLDTSGLDAGDGFLEVWLIDPDVTKLVSLGPLRPDGTYDLPAGLDPHQFPIVDVSAEPIDGNPAHSGDSLLRGELSF